MSDQDNKSPIVVYPDPIVDIEMLSGAMFLYFDNPIALTIPPVVITEESYSLWGIIGERKPEWGNTFFNLFSTWRIQNKCCSDIFEMLAPLKGQHLINIWTVYPADIAALARSQEMIESSGISFDTMKQLVNPINAPGELIRHIMLEAFLECNKNVGDLFDYCDYLFNAEPIDKLLAKSYILRLQVLRKLPANTSVLITNLPIWSQLLNDNVINNEKSLYNEGIDRDVIAWEIFKNIISPKLDPLDKEKVEYIIKLLKTRKEQIDRLKLKCFCLADKLKHVNRLDDLPEQVIDLVRSDVEKEINELLQLDKKAFNDYLALVFSDEKTWAGIAGFIAGIISGNSVITTSGAIATLSFVGSKAVQISNKRREIIRQSDYGLAYTISKKYK
jgi:hypothetical protein